MMNRVLFLSVLMGVLMVSPAPSAWAGDDAAKKAKADSGRAFDAAKRGYWLEAIALWENALELDSDNAEILNNYAVGLEATGRYEEAGHVYEKALSLDPGSRRIRKNAMLARDFYLSYVLREDPDHPGESDDGDDAGPAPGEAHDDEALQPEESPGEEAGQGDDDEQD